MSVESDALLETMISFASKPAYVQGDAGAMNMRPLHDLIDAHKYLATVGVGTTTGNGRRGIRFTKMNPPGAV